MTLYSQRTGYQTDRILIPSGRVLSPQFDQAIVSLSGSQIEILRNLVDYANRIETFVDSYGDAYYVTPDETDWDAIAAIVADLEEKLMGNDNTIWGFNEQLWLKDQGVVPASLQVLHDFGPVPAGEVWQLRGVSSLCTANPGTLHILAKKLTEVLAITDTWTWGPNLYRGQEGIEFSLIEGDVLRFNWNSITLGATVVSMAWGYKMKVPE